MEFLAESDVPMRTWRDQDRQPRGMYWSGQGRDPLEVALVEFGRAPTAGEVRAIWKDRHGRRAAPLLLVAAYPGGVLLCGTVEEDLRVVERDVGQAERLASKALTEPNRHLAIRYLAGAFDTDPDDIPGLMNKGLLATHELRNGVPLRDDWEQATADAQRLLPLEGRDLVSGLGFTIDESGRSRHALLRAGGAGNARAVAVFLAENEAADEASGRFDNKSPLSFAFVQAERAKVPWVVAVRGGALRLYKTDTSGAAGQRGRSGTYVGVDLSLLPSDQAGYLTLLFSADALAEGGTFGDISAASLNYASDLSARLRERVYSEVVPRLALAVANRSADTDTETKADLDEHFHTAVMVLFRLLFIAYAEDERLLPANTGPYAPNSLKQIARTLTDAYRSGGRLGFDDPFTDTIESSSPANETSTDLWDRCRTLFVAVDKGRADWGVPAYNGGLFSSDPTYNGAGPAIERLRLTNAEFGPALTALLVDRTPDGDVGPIDFRSLSVREFGTIYEGILESELARAGQPLTLRYDTKRKADVYVPAEDGDTVVVAAGGVYLHNASGARKASGSYFTKPFAVEHLISTAVLPTLEEHLGRVAGHLDAGDEVAAAELLFDFRVADISMGSGHFLTAVVDAVEARMSTFLAEHPIPQVAAELATLHQAARNNLGELADTVDIEQTALRRRMIARRCVYGVDINPISVELARVAMWIHTFVPGLPLSFLDHNLIDGDSLTGIGTISEAMDVLTDAGSQSTLFDDPVRVALGAAEEPLRRLGSTIDASTDDIKAARVAADDARVAVQPVTDLFDLLVAARIGYLSVPLVTALEDLPADEVRKARGSIRDLNVCHFPVAFPEVFLRERSGFDVIVGNPPWEKPQVEEHEFWGRHFPGHRGLSQRERERATAQYERDRPDLVAQLRDEKKAVEKLKAIIAAGPYDLGVGHADLAKIFSWRFLNLVRSRGRVGVVLPRAATMSAPGMEAWRREVFRRGTFSDVCMLLNNRHWVFDEVHPQYTVGLVTIHTDPDDTTVRMSGPFRSQADYTSRVGEIAAIPVGVFLSWTADASFPLLPDLDSVSVFSKFAQMPRFSAWSDRFRPVQGDINGTTNKSLLQFTEAQPPGSWPVFSGSGFHVWQPDTGNIYAYTDSARMTAHLMAKRENQARLQRSAFFGLDDATLSDPTTLPCRQARIAFRDVARATDSRTLVAALVPPDRILIEKAPYIARVGGSITDEAYLLGLFSSLIVDWFSRRIIETKVSFSILNSMPIPDVGPGHPGYQQVVEAAGRLAAVDDRYAGWAKTVGVPVGSVGNEANRDDLLAQLDACVARLYGLTEKEVEHLFATFHVGWDHQSRLEATLDHFQTLDWDAAPSRAEA